MCKAADLHGGREKEGNVATEGCVDAVADGGMDGEALSLLFGGGGKNKHVQVKKEPPEGGGVVDGGARCGRDDDGA